MSDAQPAAPDLAENGIHDFHGFTAPWNAPGQPQSRASKAAMDAWLDPLADKPHWYRRYQELLAERDPADKPRWDWRKALYIAWSALPAKLREPSKLGELADLMGLTDTASIRHWRQKDPEIDRRIGEVTVRLVGDNVANLLQAAIECGLNDGPQGFQDRKLLLEMAGIYRPKQTQEITGPEGGPVQYRSVSDISDEELARIATGSS